MFFLALLTNYLLVQWQQREIHFTQEVLAQEPEEVQIEVQINWDQTRIEEEIKRVFGPNANTALKIARCESNFNPDALNTSNADGSVDRGVMQLNSVHDSNMNALGLDPFDPADNIQFAKLLFDASGWLPWVCFTKNLI